MRWLHALSLVLLSGLALATDEKARLITFSKDHLNKMPPGWKAEQTGRNGGGVWKVVTDATAPSKKGYVLSQTGESSRPVFNLCIMDDTNIKEVEVRVAFKAVQGELDQGGGIVWRYQDANTYYLARMNPLEKNYRLYKVVAGKRIQMAAKEDLPVPVGEWHTLRIRMTGDQIECYLDGRKYLEAKDATFSQAGKVGLWTKADAQSSFDQFKVIDLKK